MKKNIVLGIAFFFLLSVVAVNVVSAEEETPDWVKRIEFSAQWETDQKPTVYFQTVQPLYEDETKENTVFIQPRASINESDATYNLGFGYRRLVSENLLLGLNVFGDYEDLHEHGRAGLGVEALGRILEARVNTYFGVTSKRVVEEGGGSSTYEKVADGIDYEIGAPIPYMPWLKLYGAGFWYDFDKASDAVGWKSRLEAKLNEAVRMEFYTWDDNKGDVEYGGRLRFNVAFGGIFDISDAFKLSDDPFPGQDVSEQTLIPVERAFDIRVEKWAETATTTVSIVRGD